MRRSSSAATSRMGPLPSETLERLRGARRSRPVDTRQCRPRARRPARRDWRRRTRSTGRGSSSRPSRSTSCTGCPSAWSWRWTASVACSSVTRRRGTTSTSSSREPPRSASRRLFDGRRGRHRRLRPHAHAVLPRDLPASASSTPAASACRTRTSPAPTGRCWGRESSTAARDYDASALAGIETPIRYFSEDRPSKAEVTEFFSTLAVGA